MKAFKPKDKNHFYIKVPLLDGTFKKHSTGLLAIDPATYDENLAEAQAQSDEVWRRYYENKEARAAESTVQGWGMRFIADRRENPKLRDVENEEQRLRDHVFAYRVNKEGLTLGAMLLDDVDGPLLVRWMDDLKKRLAPKTCHNVYSTLKTMWRKAVKLGKTKNNPCVLDSDDLPPLEDKNPDWRRLAHYTHAELWALMTDPRVPQDRRVQWALLGVGMLRDGEMAGLRRGCVELEREPLGSLLIRRSYDGPPKEKVREMPMHPVLHAILAEWLQPGGGWEQMMGRPIKDDDLVMPCPAPSNRGPRKPLGAMRDKNYIWKRIKRDLINLGFRHRRAHDLRRSGISRSLDDGADKDKLNRCTHLPSHQFDIMGRYTTHEWVALCVEVGKLELPPRKRTLQRRPVELVPLEDAG